MIQIINVVSDFRSRRRACVAMVESGGGESKGVEESKMPKVVCKKTKVRPKVRFTRQGKGNTQEIGLEAV